MTVPVRVAVMFAAVLALVVAGYAQSSSESPMLSDFAGEWELITKESESRTQIRYVSGKLTIKVIGDEVQILRQLEDTSGFSERKLVLFADGRGETNRWRSLDGEREIKRETKTKRRKRTLTSICNYKAEFGWVETKEVYELSKDGTSLAFQVIPTMVRGGRPFTSGWVERLVFKRV